MYNGAGPLQSLQQLTHRRRRGLVGRGFFPRSGEFALAFYAPIFYPQMLQICADHLRQGEKGAACLAAAAESVSKRPGGENTGDNLQEAHGQPQPPSHWTLIVNDNVKSAQKWHLPGPGRESIGRRGRNGFFSSESREEEGPRWGQNNCR